MDCYKKLLKNKNSGLVFKPTITPKLDLEVFGAPGEIVSLGRIERILNSPLKKNIYYQGSILSCVHNTIAFLNAYNSWFNDGNPIHLSWPYTYGQVRHYPGGTSADEALNFVCSKGQPQDKTFPARLAIQKGEAWAQRPPIPQEARDEALHWQSANHLKSSGDRVSLYTVLAQTPVGIGLQVGDNWNVKGKIRYQNAQFGHMCALIDILDAKNIDIVKQHTGYNLSEADYGSYITINWWEKDKLDIRILDKNYPIFWARTLVDKTDTLFIEKKDKKSMKLIKGPGAEIYLLDFSNRLHWIANEESYSRFIDAEKKFEENVEVVSQEVLESYQMGEPMNAVWNNVGEMLKFYVRHRLLDIQ